MFTSSDGFLQMSDQATDFPHSSMDTSTYAQENITHLASDKRFPLVLHFCGIINDFCTASAANNCMSTKLISCQDCDVPAALGFVCAVAVLGLAVLFGNSLIVWIGIQRYRNGTALKIDAIKISLAVADLLTAFQIFVVVLPNFAHIFGSTMQQRLTYYINKQWNVAQLWFYAVTLRVGLVASQYHLVLLGIQRMYAIMRPLRYQRQPPRSVYIALAVAWIFAILFSFCPEIWFPETTHFVETSSLYVMITTREDLLLWIYKSGMFIAPLTLMTITSLITIISAHMKLRRSRQQLGMNPANLQAVKLLKREFEVFETVAIMQIGFTITLAPWICIYMMKATDSPLLHCDDIPKTLLIINLYCFSNSLVNVLVYSARDDKFRSSAASVIKFILCGIPRRLMKAMQSRNQTREQNVLTQIQRDELELIWLYVCESQPDDNVQHYGASTIR